jgi:endonuclease/exonuclease/phosphatase family metal-dependent hydrolase
LTPMGAAASLRVLTLNLRGCFTWDGGNPWPVRWPLIARLVERHAPDLIACQEALWPNLICLRQSLSHHRCHRGHPGGSTRLLGVYNPVFWTPAKLAIHAADSFWLSDRPNRFSSSWGTRHTRTATWLHLSHQGRSFFVVNLHLDHQSREARLRGSELIIRRLRAMGWPDIPAVVLGDFNANPDHPEHALWLDAGMRDTWQTMNLPEDALAYTVHGFKGRRISDETRIDWILHSAPMEPSRVAILTDSSPPRYPSDHYPVIADLTWS